MLYPIIFFWILNFDKDAISIKIQLIDIDIESPLIEKEFGLISL